MKLTILHLTDLHVDKRIMFLKEKTDSISKIINTDSFSDNVLLLFSGDLTFSGHERQFKLVEDFIQLIKSKTQKSIHFAFCPGNHDRLFPDGTFITSDIISSINQENFCEMFDKFEYLNSNYNKFVATIVDSKKRNRLNEVLEKVTYDFDSEKVCVYSLNDSLLSQFCDPPCQNRVFIPNDMLRIQRGNESFSILLTHIPLADLRDDTRAIIKNKCGNHIDIIVDGHIHENKIVLHNNNEFLELTSSPLYAGDISGFSLVHIDNSKLSLSMYLFDDEAGVFINQNQDFKDELPIKLATSDGLFLSNEILSLYNEKKRICGFEIGLDEIFVFPKLVERNYQNIREKKCISTIDEFFDCSDKRNTILIYGEQESGKSSLARELFFKSLEKDDNPIICDGGIFNKKKMKKSIKEIIDLEIKNNYKNRDADKLFFGSSNKKILIVDNASEMTEMMVAEFNKYFDKTILLINPTFESFFSVDHLARTSSLVLDIEFFYREKREELYRKMYYAVGSRNPIVFSNFALEDFVLRIEEAIEKVEQKIVIDLDSLIDFCGSALINIDVLNGTDTNFIGNRFQIIISDFLKRESIERITTNTVERIIGRVAYTLYECKQTLFEEDFLSDIKNSYSLEYDETLFSYPAKKIINILMSLKIIKEVNGKYLFYSRSIFAHYIGFHAMHKFDNDYDPSCLETIINNGVYLPLNFAILMDIAVSRNNENILERFIDMLSKDVETYKFTNKNVSSIAIYFDSERKRAIEISENDIKIRRRQLSQKEERQRQEYLDNSSNYFYEKFTTKEMKDLIETFNKGRIIASLMNHGDMLKQNQKDRLCKLDIFYPNVVIDKYISLVKKSFDDLYIKILDNIDEKKADKRFEKELDSFFDYLLSFVTATILSIYDSSSRPIHNIPMAKKLTSFINKNEYFSCSFMPDIQRLMLLSFSRDLDKIYLELKSFMDKTNNKYYAQCAYLIGRRVVMDNYETIRKTNRPFFEYIKNGSSASATARLLIEKKKV